MLSCVYSGIHFEEMTKEQVIGILKDTLEYAKEKDKEIERLQNKNEELMTLYTTEREVKEDYKSIIKEVREYIEEQKYPFCDGYDFREEDAIKILSILDKENKDGER